MFYLYMHKENDIRDALNIINKLNMGDSEYITYTDSDRSRIALVRLKAALNKVPGILILYKISYLGQTTTAICRELSWLKERQIITIFIEYPSTWTIDEKLNQNGLSVVLDVFQNQTKSQAYPGLPSAPLPGRKKIDFQKTGLSYMNNGNGKKSLPGNLLKDQG